MSITKGMAALGILEIGLPEIMNNYAGEFRQNSNLPCGFVTTLAVTGIMGVGGIDGTTIVASTSFAAICGCNSATTAIMGP